MVKPHPKGCGPLELPRGQANPHFFVSTMSTLQAISTILRAQWDTYRTNPKDSRNPNFCVGCFELTISKIFATASKMGEKIIDF